MLAGRGRKRSSLPQPQTDLEQHASQRPVVLDRRRAVTHRLHADVIRAGVEMGADRLGHLLRRPVRHDGVDQAVAAAALELGSSKPSRSRLLR